MTETAPLIETLPAPEGLSPAMTGQRWTTAHGDRVTVWQAGALGRLIDWRWHVQARNGEIVGQGEGHPRRRSARIAAMRHHPPVGQPAEVPAALVERLAGLLDRETAGPPGDDVRKIAEAWAAELAPLLTVAPPLPADQVETTWPAAWFSYLDDSPDVGAEVLVDGTPYRVAARYPDGVPDRIRVRLTRSEIRRA